MVAHRVDVVLRDDAHAQVVVEEAAAADNHAAASQRDVFAHLWLLAGFCRRRL